MAVSPTLFLTESNLQSVEACHFNNFEVYSFGLSGAV